VFAFAVDRPLSLGVLRLEIVQKTKQLSVLPSPKLVILAGSNGPFSHSCAVIGAMLNLPCENAGIAVGIGVDDLFARYAPYLHAGDVLYMPMETAQYTITRAENRAGADDGILLRHDRTMLLHLPADRLMGAAFCCTLSDLLESAAEMPIARAGLIKPATLLNQEYNSQGDRINATRATADQDLLKMPARPAPDAAGIQNGHGAKLISQFVAAQTAQGVIVIGGLSTDFNDAKLPAATIQAISKIYTSNGGIFLTLPNHSQYPRADFYDSEDHLAQPCQFRHSIAIAHLLAAALHRIALPPENSTMKIAAMCP
jgi:hypothetical protein